MLLDEELRTLLPGGQFSFKPENGLPVDDPALSKVQDLLLAVLVAAEKQNLVFANKLSGQG